METYCVSYIKYTANEKSVRKTKQITLCCLWQEKKLLLKIKNSTTLMISLK